MDRWSASILHADLDSFYASVEQRDDPTLRGRPVVAGMGVVLAASYEAKRFGVRTAMSEAAARRLCPHLVVRPARFEAYSAASTAVFEIFDDTSPTVEGISIDEAFLDVSGMRRIAESPAAIARELRRRIAAEVGLAITVGVARTKFLAKVASGVGKPDGLLVVDPDRELEFLHPLGVERLWGVGEVTARKLAARGISTVGEVAALDRDVLIGLVGKAAGHQLHALAHNVDARRVTSGVRRRSIGSQQALGRGQRTHRELQVMLAGVVDRVTRRMRLAGRSGRTVTLRLRFDDFSRIARSSSFPQPTSATGPITEVAAALLAQAWPMISEQGITLIGMSVSNLVDDDRVGGSQLALSFDAAASDRVDDALDAVRERFGAASLTRASRIGTDADAGTPKLAD